MVAKAQIWVDADACPKVIRDILFRAAQRTGIELTLIANQGIPVPPNRNIRSIQVSSGFDEADNEIVARCNAGDLVVTQDIPLASDALAKGAAVVSPRGEAFTADTIGSRLNMRDFLDTMRASGEHTGGPRPLNQADRQQFSNQLDRWLTQNYR